MTLTFDPKTHIYRVDGYRKSSITGIINAGGLVDSQWFTEEAAFRGSVVHRCTELEDKGTLQESSVDPGAVGFLESWRTFKRQTGFIPLVIEKRHYNETHDYCGTPDRFGVMGNGDRAVVELKTGEVQKWCKVQLAGQLGFIEPSLRGLYRRFGVRLKSDGIPTVTEYPREDMPSDWAAFLACLTISNWKRVNNAN